MPQALWSSSVVKVCGQALWSRYVVKQALHLHQMTRSFIKVSHTTLVDMQKTSITDLWSEIVHCLKKNFLQNAMKG